MLDDKEFDRTLSAYRRIAIAGAIVSSLISLSVLGFIGWVVIKMLAHFGVI